MRAGLEIPRQHDQPCWVFVAGSLTSRTVWSQSGRSSARVMPIARAIMALLPGARARRAASLACAPVTHLFCGLLFCTLYDLSLVSGWCTKQQPPPTLFPFPIPSKRGLDQTISFFSHYLFCVCSLFFLASRLPTKEIEFLPQLRPEGLQGSGGATR